MADRYCPNCGEKMTGRYCKTCGYDSGEGDDQPYSDNRMGSRNSDSDTNIYYPPENENNPSYYEQYGGNYENPGPKRNKKGQFKTVLIAVIAAAAAAAAVLCYFLFFHKETYTVTFDPGDGQVVSGALEQTVKEGETAEAPEVELEGYDFSGWNPELSPVESNITYTAVWNKQKYTSEKLYEAVSKSVVEINIYLKDDTEYSLGSGFFIDTEGTIVTNFHVIENASKIKALLEDGSTCDIDSVVAWSKDKDLAILKADYKSEPLTISSEEVKNGEEVYAIGSSLGLTGTMSEGIVSQKSREVDGVDYIQFTAPISPGNSGGPLLNSFGEVIGINTMQMNDLQNDAQNLNFAINAATLGELDTSHPITVAEFTQQDDHSDPGEDWAQTADHLEQEDNNKAGSADLLYENESTSGYVDKSDHDYYRIEIDKDSSVAVLVGNYYEVDNDYMRVVLFDEDLNGGYMLDDGETRSGAAYKYYSGELPAGSYYLYIDLDASDDEYPYSTGAYYVIYYSTSESETASEPEPETEDTINVIHDIKAPASDFVFPNSSTRLLTQDDLDSMLSSDQDEMRSVSQMAINEIYARYGWTFATSENPSSTALEAKAKFEALDWYREAQKYCPTNDTDDLYKNYMNSVERQNILLLRDWQNQHVRSS